MLPPCNEGTDGVLMQGITYDFTISAKAEVLQTGATVGFTFYSPDGSIAALDFNSITLLGGWATTSYWTLGGGLLTVDTNGTLPESFLIGGAALPGGGFMEPNFVDIAEVSVQLPNLGGMVCLDSAFYPPAGEWEMQPGGSPVWLGGGGDIGQGGSRTDALCYEVRLIPEPPSTSTLPCGWCLPAAITLTDCDTLSFVAGTCLSEWESFNRSVSVSAGFGVATWDDSLNLTYIPSPLDTVSNYARITLSYDFPTTDHCGNPITGHCEPTIDLTILSCLCCDVPGDANHDGTVTIADVTYNIARIFSGGPSSRCPFEADANSSGSLTIADVTYLIQHIFAGGPAPVCGSASG